MKRRGGRPEDPLWSPWIGGGIGFVRDNDEFCDLAGHPPKQGEWGGLSLPSRLPTSLSAISDGLLFIREKSSLRKKKADAEKSPDPTIRIEFIACARNLWGNLYEEIKCGQANAGLSNNFHYKFPPWFLLEEHKQSTFNVNDHIMSH